MKKHIFYFLALVSFITLSSCETETPEPTGIDFITINEDSKSFLLNEGATLSTEFEVYTASNVSTDLVVNLEVTTTLDASNYTVPATITIPANSNKAVFGVSVTENGLDKINGETMSINLSTPDAYFSGVSELALKFDVFCESAIPTGVFSYADGNRKLVAISNEGTNVNEFIISGDNGFTTNYWFMIKDQCGSLSVIDARLNGFGLDVSGSGEILPNGNIVFTYTVDGYFTDRTMTIVTQ